MPNTTTRTCQVETCTNPIGPHGARGWCPTHYKRWRANGNPEALRFTPRGSTTEERLLWYIKDDVQPDDCWEWQGFRDDGGYGKVGQDGRPGVASRVAYQTWVGPIPTGYVICHRCDNPPCINPKHLFAGKPADNTADMIAKRRGAHGERHPWHRLTDEQVHTIRYLSDAGMQQRPIAKLIGCSQSQVSNIVRRLQRRHDTNWTPKPELVKWLSANHRQASRKQTASSTSV